MKCIKHILLFLFLLLLGGCSHMERKDGPPDFYVDESKIPNAVPRKEPLSKYGNMSSYRVFGRRYYTLKSGRHYEAVGIASWYGTKFHKIRTSSGEPYNMLAMTAAHKTLPLPTYVEVTNLKNRRKIIVKVNDRGPFSGNRLIDLSYVAAKKLGMIGRGTTYVRVRAIDVSPFRFHEPRPFYFSPAPRMQMASHTQTFEKHALRRHVFQKRPLRIASNHHSYGKHVFRRHVRVASNPHAYSKHVFRRRPRVVASNMHASHRHVLRKRHYLQVGAFHHKSHAVRIKKQKA